MQLAERLPFLPLDACEMALEEELDDHMICAGGVGADTCRGKRMEKSLYHTDVSDVFV